jgi:hypothetical protein
MSTTGMAIPPRMPRRMVAAPRRVVPRLRHDCGATAVTSTSCGRGESIPARANCRRQGFPPEATDDLHAPWLARLRTCCQPNVIPRSSAGHHNSRRSRRTWRAGAPKHPGRLEGGSTAEVAPAAPPIRRGSELQAERNRRTLRARTTAYVSTARPRRGPRHPESFPVVSPRVVVPAHAGRSRRTGYPIRAAPGRVAPVASSEAEEALPPRHAPDGFLTAGERRNR